ncbi:MAG: arginine--tRNA ligase, partial [Spirochaetes bacterium]|nr:arginine--tRNA ligase [Spirochaetota bacterium]
KDGELMSTRKGNVIFLEDVIEEARLLSLKKIMEDEGLNESSVTDEINERASRIAISSIVFFDLRNGRIKDIDFNWDEILNPIGETGVYLQYAHARIHGIMRKFEERMRIKVSDLKDSPISVSEDESYLIITELAQFPTKVLYAAENFEPSVISRYLLDLASAFSTYYKANRVINEDNAEISKERMSIVLAVKEILGEGLRLLGITPMEKM